jgi:hypothetical protein
MWSGSRPGERSVSAVESQTSVRPLSPDLKGRGGSRMYYSQVSACVNASSRLLPGPSARRACATTPVLGALAQAGTANSRFQRKKNCFTASGFRAGAAVTGRGARQTRRRVATALAHCDSEPRWGVAPAVRPLAGASSPDLDSVGFMGIQHSGSRALAPTGECRNHPWMRERPPTLGGLFSFVRSGDEISDHDGYCSRRGAGSAAALPLARRRSVAVLWQGPGFASLRAWSCSEAPTIPA